MNVKLHTPNSLKTGSGISSWKQFLLSLIATTVSIVLTFGTAAVIDHNKKVKAKKEMVMMVISDFDKSIEIAQKADSALRYASHMQQEIAIHPETFDSLRYHLIHVAAFVYDEFPETTEKIFSTSIETFNTIGDANFVNDASSFYISRHKYQQFVIDALKHDLEEKRILDSYGALMDLSFPDYALLSWGLMKGMKEYRDKCMKRMDVSEEDIIKFNKQQIVENSNTESDSIPAEILKELELCNEAVIKARENNKN